MILESSLPDSVEDCCDPCLSFPFAWDRRRDCSTVSLSLVDSPPVSFMVHTKDLRTGDTLFIESVASSLNLLFAVPRRDTLFSELPELWFS